MDKPRWLSWTHLVLFGLMATSWLLMVVGVSVAHGTCIVAKHRERYWYSNESWLIRRSLLGVPEPDAEPVTHGRQLLDANLSASSSCGTRLALAWWTVWFQFVCLCLGFLVAASPGTFRRWGQCSTMLFAISAASLLNSAKSNYDAIRINSHNRSLHPYVASTCALLAGTITSIGLDMVLVVLSLDATGQLTPTLPPHVAAFCQDQSATLAAFLKDLCASLAAKVAVLAESAKLKAMPLLPAGIRWEAAAPPQAGSGVGTHTSDGLQGATPATPQPPSQDQRHVRATAPKAAGAHPGDATSEDLRWPLLAGPVAHSPFPDAAVHVVAHVALAPPPPAAITVQVDGQGAQHSACQ